MQVTLYSAAETVRALLEQIDPETGEMSLTEMMQTKATVGRWFGRVAMCMCAGLLLIWRLM